MSESLNKRLAYLAIADMDYLSARLLLLCGLTHTGLSKACEAFEKLLKLFLLLESKITKNEELEGKILKREYEHQLLKIFNQVKTRIPATFDTSWDNYFQQLENAYKMRYPESWKKGKLENNLRNLDEAYSYLRNNISSNFPIEEQKKSKQFGGFIYKAYTPQINTAILKLGDVMIPKDIFYKKNDFTENFDIDVEKL